MYRSFWICCIVLFLSYDFARAQQDRCAAHHYLEQQKRKGSYTTPLLTGLLFRPMQAQRTIPVVVHVIYNNAAENISDLQIFSQLEVINQDFNLKNRDSVLVPTVFKPVMAGIDIEFKLARTDPNGQLTDGINRIQTNQPFFSFNDAVKFSSSGGADAWPTDKYLNIWVCNLQSPILGYSSFPGEAPQNDGVVVDFEVFGKVGNLNSSFDQGRTLTHELGHYFNLFHIWADEDNCFASDSIDDTPVQRSATFGCPQHPRVSCTPGGDMFMNYMDYSNDECLLMFTQGQRARMLQTLSGFRTALGTHGLHKPPIIQGTALRWISGGVYLPFACGFTPTNVLIESFGSDTVLSISLEWTNGFTNATSSSTFDPPIFPGEQRIISISPPQGLALSPELSLRITEANSQPFNGDTILVIWENFKDTSLLKATSFWDVETPQDFWYSLNPDTLDPLEFEGATTSAFGKGELSVKLDMVNAPLSALGQSDWLYSPIIGIKDTSKNYLLDWDGACLAQSNRLFGVEERIEVEISKDCGVNFVPLTILGFADLITGNRSAITINSPPTNSQWKQYSLEIPIETPSTLQVRFKVLNSGRSIMYLDNFSLKPAEENLPALNFAVFPNPASKEVNVLANRIPGLPIELTIFSVTGQKIKSTMITASQFSDSFAFDLPQDISKQLVILSFIAQGQSVQRLKLMID